MANIVRSGPMREMMSLREAMNQLFDDSFTRPFGNPIGFGAPEIEMYAEKDNVVVKAEMPGLKPEQVSISILGDVLTLKGEYEQQEDKKDRTYHLRERRTGSFERSVRLPSEVVADKATAEFENGVLSITMPKSEDVKPKSIAIKVK